MPLGGVWTSKPTIVRHADGHLEVFLVGTDGNIHSKSQSGPGQAFVADWTMLPTHLQISLYGEDLGFDPLTTRVGYLLDGAGRTTIFARTTRGRTVYMFAAPGWSDWTSMAAVQDGHPAIGSPVGLIAPQGPSLTDAPTVYTRGRSGDVLRKRRNAPPDDWGDPADWTSIGGIISSEIAVAQATTDPAHELSTSVFVRGTDNDLWWNGETVQRDSTHHHGRAFGDWLPAHTDRFPEARLAGNPVATTPSDVVWRGTNGSLWSGYADSQGNFSGIDDLHLPTAGDPTVAHSASTQWMFWRDPDGRIHVRTSPTGAPRTDDATVWSGVAAIGDPVASVSVDGRAEVVFVCADGQLYHLWETGVDSGVFNEGP